MTQTPGYPEKDNIHFDTFVDWVDPIDPLDEHEIGNPLIDEEIGFMVKKLKELAKIKRVFSWSARARLYRWLKLNMKNCYIDEYATDQQGVVEFAIGVDEDAVIDYIRTK